MSLHEQRTFQSDAYQYLRAKFKGKNIEWVSGAFLLKHKDQTSS